MLAVILQVSLGVTAPFKQGLTFGAFNWDVRVASWLDAGFPNSS